MAESVVGSPLYMAPELLEYKSYDAKADLWSVGIILYEMLANDHPFLIVDNCHATNHLALRRNIMRYYERNGRFRVPKHIQVSPECEQLLEALLRIDPRQRVSFEDFFRAPFLLPPTPANSSTDLESSASSAKPALVATKQSEYGELCFLTIVLNTEFNGLPHVYCKTEDWANFSDEYVIVESEYEDVGRKVLDGQDLDVDKAKVKKAAPSGQTVAAADAVNGDAVGESVAAIVDGGVEIRDVVVDTSSPNGSAEIVAADDGEHENGGMPSREVIPVAANDNWKVGGDQKDWVTDDTTVQELLGICYKSFECGGVALFVPTPFGDYIAFHEGCPHYYLSMESIAAAKRDDR